MQCVPKTTLVQSVSVHFYRYFLLKLDILLVFKLYYYLRKAVMPVLHYWPHLVIYLDAPVNKCLERIKQRGNANEVAVVDEAYLQIMADSYKDALREFK